MLSLFHFNTKKAPKKHVFKEHIKNTLQCFVSLNLSLVLVISAKPVPKITPTGQPNINRRPVDMLF